MLGGASGAPAVLQRILQSLWSLCRCSTELPGALAGLRQYSGATWIPCMASAEVDGTSRGGGGLGEMRRERNREAATYRVRVLIVLIPCRNNKTLKA